MSTNITINTASAYNNKSVVIAFEPTGTNIPSGTLFGVTDWGGTTGLTIKAHTSGNVRWLRMKNGTTQTFDSNISANRKLIAVTSFNSSGNSFSAQLYTWDGGKDISNVYNLGFTDLSSNTSSIGDDYRNYLGSTEYNFSNDIFTGRIYACFLAPSVPTVSELSNIMKLCTPTNTGSTITFDIQPPYNGIIGTKIGTVNVTNNQYISFDGTSNFLRLDPDGAYIVEYTYPVTNLSSTNKFISFTEPSDLSGITNYKIVYSTNLLTQAEIYNFNTTNFYGTLSKTTANAVRSNISLSSIGITGLLLGMTYNVYVMSYSSSSSSSASTLYSFTISTTINTASSYDGKSIVIAFEPLGTNIPSGTLFGITDWQGTTGLTIKAHTGGTVRWLRMKNGTTETFDSTINATNKLIAVTSFNSSGNSFSAQLYTWNGGKDITSVYNLGFTDLSSSTSSIGDDYRNTLGSSEYNFSNDMFIGRVYACFVASSIPTVSELSNIMKLCLPIDNGSSITFDIQPPYNGITGIKSGGINVTNNQYITFDGTSNLLRLDPGGSFVAEYTYPVTNLSASNTTISFTEPSDLSGITNYKVVYSTTLLTSSEIYNFNTANFYGTISTTTAGAIRSNILLSSIGITGISGGTTYNVYVMSYSTSSISSATTLYIPPTVPSAPSNVTAVAGYLEATISWTAPNDGGSTITGYKIERSLNSSTWSIVISNTNNSNTSYLNTGLSVNTLYYYRVSAINSVGTGATSSVASVTITKTKSVTNLTSTVNGASNTATISWTAAESTLTYDISNYTITYTATNPNNYISPLEFNVDLSGTYYYTNFADLSSVTNTSLINSSLYNTKFNAAYTTYLDQPTTTGGLWMDYDTNFTYNAINFATTFEIKVAVLYNTGYYIYVNSGDTRYKIQGQGPDWGDGFNIYGPDSSNNPTVVLYPPLNTTKLTSSLGGTLGITRRNNGFTVYQFANNIYTELYTNSSITWTNTSNKSFTFGATYRSPFNYIYWVKEYSTPVWFGNGLDLSGTVTTSLTNRTFTTFANNVTYNVNVIANSYLGESDTTSTSSLPYKIAKPILIRPTAGYQSIALKWLAPLTTYNLSNYTISWNNGTTSGSTTLTDLSYNITSLTNITSHTINIFANYTDGSSNITTTATPLAYTVPSQITSVTATAGNTFVDLSWNAPSNGGSAITGYLVERSQDLSSWAVDVSSNATLSYRSTGLTNGTLYYFRVSAINIAGTGTASASVSATPQGTDSYVDPNKAGSIVLYTFSEDRTKAGTPKFYTDTTKKGTPILWSR